MPDKIEGFIIKAISEPIELKKFDRENRTIRGVATVENEQKLDRDNDIVRTSGIDLKEFKKNPRMMWAHDYAQPPIARIIDIQKVDKKLDFTAKFPRPGIYPFADMLFELSAEDFVGALSIGFRPLDWKWMDSEAGQGMGGRDFKKIDLLEISLVSIPANSDALLQLRSLSMEKDQTLVNIKKQLDDLAGMLEGFNLTPKAMEGMSAAAAELIPAPLALEIKTATEIAVAGLRKEFEERFKALAGSKPDAPEIKTPQPPEPPVQTAPEFKLVRVNPQALKALFMGAVKEAIKTERGGNLETKGGN